MAVRIRNTKTSLRKFYGSREQLVHLSAPLKDHPEYIKARLEAAATGVVFHENLYLGKRFAVGKGTVYKREERRAPRKNRKARASQRAKSRAVAFEKRMG